MIRFHILCVLPLAALDVSAMTAPSVCCHRPDEAIPRHIVELEHPDGRRVSPFSSGAVPVSQRVRLAHAILVRSLPEKEATVTDIPEEVLLTFNEGVGSDYLALAVVDENGKRVDRHDARLDFTDRSHLRASLTPLAAGRYTVRYRVLSADGHVVSGKYFFQIKKQ